MIELAQHIEVLLLENDCVIVPRLGGFVSHYTPAMRVEEENIFLPPTRIIGFNPQLKMNDGLLIQSYMAIYGTNFSDATKIVDKEVDELFAILHEEGLIDLINVGELRYSVHGTYDFAPYNNKITTPYLYGLDSFEMQELSALEKPLSEKNIPLTPTALHKDRPIFKLNIKRSYWANAAAMIAMIALFFCLSAPIENTEVFEGNYAQLLPSELFERIEKQSLAITPIIVSSTNDTRQATMQSKPAVLKKKVITPVAVKATPTDTKIAKPYHIIIASVGTENDAIKMANELIEKGFIDAKAIVGGGRMRVSIESCATEAEAYQVLNKFRQNEAYQNAWVLKK